AIRAGAVSGCAPCRFEGRIPLHARWLAAVSIAIIRLARMGNGCFLFCTRDAFIAAGGFDETLYGAEDIALSRALKRIGSFAVLRERVITSGRKVRAHTGREA